MSEKRRRKVERRAKRRKGWRTMPKATVNSDPTTHNLISCPGGWVKLRRMTFGELMASQDMAYQVQMKASEEDPDNPEMGVNVSRAAVMEYQFRTCVLDHNLEGDTGKLDFNLSRDVHLLDSNVGQEISSTIDEMHNWKKQAPNSDGRSGNGSSTSTGRETVSGSPDVSGD